MQCKEMLYGLFFSPDQFTHILTPINLMYYDTMVQIMKNYFSHQTSELGTSYCKCQADLCSTAFCISHVQFCFATTKLVSNNKK